MMAVGWMAFLGSWLMNTLFYKFHPSSVDFSKKGMREKLFIHVQGEKRYLPGYKKWESKGEKYCIKRISSIFGNWPGQYFTLATMDNCKKFAVIVSITTICSYSNFSHSI